MSKNDTKDPQYGVEGQEAMGKSHSLNGEDCCKPAFGTTGQRLSSSEQAGGSGRTVAHRSGD